MPPRIQTQSLPPLQRRPRQDVPLLLRRNIHREKINLPSQISHRPRRLPIPQIRLPRHPNRIHILPAQLRCRLHLHQPSNPRIVHNHVIPQPSPIRRRHHQPLFSSPRQKPRLRNIPSPFSRTSTSLRSHPRSAQSTPNHLGPSRPDTSHKPSQKYKRRTPGTGQAPQNLFLLSNSSISSQPPILDNFWNFILSLEYRTYKQNPQKHPLTTFSKNEIFQPKPPNTANLCTPHAFANHALAPHANVARAPRPRG